MLERDDEADLLLVALASYTLGDWSPKDHQAHLTAWKKIQSERIQAATRGEQLAADARETDERNAELQALRADSSWDEIAREADEVSDQLVADIRAAGTELLTSREGMVGQIYGNSASHATTHFIWLSDAGIGVDTERVAAFLGDHERQLMDAPWRTPIAPSASTTSPAHTPWQGGSNGRGRSCARRSGSGRTSPSSRRRIRTSSSSATSSRSSLPGLGGDLRGGARRRGVDVVLAGDLQVEPGMIGRRLGVGGDHQHVDRRLRIGVAEVTRQPLEQRGAALLAEHRPEEARRGDRARRSAPGSARPRDPARSRTRRRGRRRNRSRIQAPAFGRLRSTIWQPWKK